MALNRCDYMLHKGHLWTFAGTFRELSWTSISDIAACATNSDGVAPTSSLGKGFTLETCQAACAQMSTCVAVDFFAATEQCNLYETACEHPLQTKHNASSFRVVESKAGSPGALKLGGQCLGSTSENGAESLELVTCSGEEDQAFSAVGAHFQRASDGACLDVRWCWGAVCASMELQTAACNAKHPNQEFALDLQSGFLTSNASGQPLCATACIGQQTLLV